MHPERFGDEVSAPAAGRRLPPSEDGIDCSIVEGDKGLREGAVQSRMLGYHRREVGPSDDNAPQDFRVGGRIGA
ncbi:hypothetical protein GCM10010401_09770 [Rarobacter faecitabidus]